MGKTRKRQGAGKPAKQEIGKRTKHHAGTHAVGKKTDKQPQHTAMLPVKQIADSQHKQKPQPRSARREGRQSQTRQNPLQRKQNAGKKHPGSKPPDAIQRVGGDPAAPLRGASAPARAPAHGESPAPLPPCQ